MVSVAQGYDYREGVVLYVGDENAPGDLCPACKAVDRIAPFGGCGDPRHTWDRDVQGGSAHVLPRSQATPVLLQPVPAGARYTEQDLDRIKEMSRKLGWAVCSTLAIRGRESRDVYTWAEGYARKVIAMWGVDKSSRPP